MPNFESDSKSTRISIGENMIWIHDQQYDIKNHINWIKANASNIVDSVVDVAWRKYGGQINTSEDDYKKHFTLYAITFFEKGAFELTFKQVGPSNPMVKAIYTKEKRLTMVE